MEPSEEIRQVVTRFFEALRDGDEEGVRNHVSRQPLTADSSERLAAVD